MRSPVKIVLMQYELEVQGSSSIELSSSLSRDAQLCESVTSLWSLAPQSIVMNITITLYQDYCFKYKHCSINCFCQNTQLLSLRRVMFISCQAMHFIKSVFGMIARESGKREIYFCSHACNISVAV